MLCPGCGQERWRAEWRPSQWKNHSPSDPLGQFRYCRSCEAGPLLQPGLQSRADEPEELVQWTANWSDVLKAKVVGNHKGYTILSSQGTVFLGLSLGSYVCLLLWFQGCSKYFLSILQTQRTQTFSSAQVLWRQARRVEGSSESGPISFENCFYGRGWENWFENVCGPDLRRTGANSQLFGHFTRTKSAVDARGLWNVHTCRRKTFQLSWLGKMVAGSDNDDHAVWLETLVTLQFCCSTCFSCSKSRQGRWDNRHFGQTGWGNDLCCFDKPRCKAHRGVDGVPDFDCMRRQAMQNNAMPVWPRDCHSLFFGRSFADRTPIQRFVAVSRQGTA